MKRSFVEDVLVVVACLLAFVSVCLIENNLKAENASRLASTTTTWDEDYIRGPKTEFGLRSDGVVVWRETKAAANQSR